MTSFEELRLPPTVRAALEAYRDRLLRRFGARLVELRLFGSFVRGEATEASDVDVLVVVTELSAQERDEAIDLAYDTVMQLDEWVELSPLVYSAGQATELRSRERALLRAIDREGCAL